MRKALLFTFLLLPFAVRAQISGAGNIGCSGVAVTGTAITSATANNTVVTSLTNFQAWGVLVQLDQTTTVTGGAVTFNSSGDSSTNFVAVPVAQVLNPSTYVQLTNPYTLVASTNQGFLILLNGATNFQVKLTTAMTGTGTITPYLTAICSNPNPLVLDSSGNLKINIAAQTLNPLNQQGTLGDNGAAASTNRVGTLPCIYRTDYHGGTAATTGRDGGPDCGDDGLLHATILPDLSIKRYRASSKFAASSTTDNWRISGNASNTVVVTRLYVTCTQTTAGILNMELRKESSAVSGGTAATVTNLPVDSNKAAASSVVQSFTGTGPTVGTLVADIDNQQIGCLAGSTAAGDDIFLPLTAPGAPIAILRGTAEGLALNLGGAVTGGNLTVTVEWQEVTTITP